jgi:4-amino-4-deoxy-L-arabinose transferase-like glycosyltransferase
MYSLASRPAHYAVLIGAHLLMTLPNLGAHSLWDMDEGVNAEAAREMLESGNWITPYFNYEIRTAKPALLYWLEAGSFQVLGVNEFAARLPSVLCGLGAVLMCYELGRRMFSASTGLISALILASCVEFCLISHAATPDPPLLLFLGLAFYWYWAGLEGDRRWWFAPVGAATGLAVLTKGPIGVAMPGLVILLHLAWTRRLDKLWDRRVLLGAAAFLAVAAPWYVLVTLDTRGKWLEAFVLKENFDRFQNPADGHRGAVYYHVALLLILFVPWTAFLIPTVWNAVREARRPRIADDLDTAETDLPGKYRFLIVTVLAYLVFFSLAATKLPNYVLPLYPALAILTGRMLDRWRTGDVEFPRWVMATSVVGLGLVAVVLILGLLVAAGAIPIPITIKGFHPLPALRDYATLGAIPAFVAVVFGWLMLKGRRDQAVAVFAAGAVGFMALLAAFPTIAMNEYKVPKYFAEDAGLRQPNRDIRIAAIGWYRHSMVFYAEREVTHLYSPNAVDQFLALPRPAYLLVAEADWEQLSKIVTVPTTVIARRYDFYSRKEILVIANRYATGD